MRASDIVVDQNVSLLLKAPWGHGKTIAAASFALLGPVYIAYFDKQNPIELKTYYQKFGAKGQRILDNIEYDIFSSANANEYLNKIIKFQKDCQYVAVITDSITNVTSAAVNWSLSFRGGKAKKNVERLSIIPDWDEYKTETSLVTQVIDIFRGLPVYCIFIAHPVSSVKVEGSGASIKVTKVNPIVSYGSKVGSIVPGNFSEIYHFAKQTDYSSGALKTRYIVSMDAVGDDFAKSNLGLTGELDITNGFFYEIWKEKIRQHQKEVADEVAKEQAKIDAAKLNPFENIIDSSIKKEESQSEPKKKWDPNLGKYV